MEKKILVLYFHPQKNSLNVNLAKNYLKGIKKRHKNFKISQVYMYDLDFDLRFFGFLENQILEKDLLFLQRKIKLADHIVLVYPIWWYSFPAILKSFLDRVFLPNFAYNFNKNSFFPKKYLKNKTASAIVTQDSPNFLHKFIFGKPDYKIIKYSLNFCGISLKKIHYFDRIYKKNSYKIKKMKILSFRKGYKEFN